MYCVGRSGVSKANNFLNFGIKVTEIAISFISSSIGQLCGAQLAVHYIKEMKAFVSSYKNNSKFLLLTSKTCCNSFLLALAGFRLLLPLPLPLLRLAIIMDTPTVTAMPAVMDGLVHRALELLP